MVYASIRKNKAGGNFPINVQLVIYQLNNGGFIFGSYL